MGDGKVQLEDIKFVETKTVLMSKIQFDENNPNVMSKEKHEALDKVIVQYGFAKDPWLNENKDGTYLVIDGEQGIRQMQEHGVKKFQAKIFNVSYLQVRILRQIANKLHGEHDVLKDAEEYKAIFEADSLEDFAELLGEAEEEFQRVLEDNFDIEFDNDEEEIPEPPIEPKSKLGEIYQLGNHRVMCGDSLDIEQTKKLMNNKKSKLILTDPPYGQIDQKWDVKIDWDVLAKTFKDILYENGQVHIFCKFPFGFELNKKFSEYFKFWYDVVWCKVNSGNFAIVDRFKPAHESILFYINHTSSLTKNISDIMIQGEPYHTIDRKGQTSSIIDIKRKNSENLTGLRYPLSHITMGANNILKEEGGHPTQKPTPLLKNFILYATNKNELVYDSFLGSGSTLITCEQTNRICYGMELDCSYIDVILDRWSNYTNKDPIRLSDGKKWSKIKKI